MTPPEDRRHLRPEDLDQLLEAEDRLDLELQHTLENLLFHLVEKDPASRQVASALLERLARQRDPDLQQTRSPRPGGHRLRMRGELLARRAERFLERSDRLLHEDPHSAARCAERALQRATEAGELGAGDLGLVHRCRARWGNALRVSGRLADAERQLAPLVTDEDFGQLPASLRAETLSLAASLRQAQRRLPEAHRLLVRALDEYHLLQDRLGQVRVLLKTATVHHMDDDSSTAAEVIHTALGRLTPEDEPLYTMARHNLAQYLVADGQYREALEVWEELGDPSRSIGPLALHRHYWLRGQIAIGLGDEETAETMFRDVQAGFLDHGLGYPAALVSLDLAELLLRQGRTGDVQSLAAGMTWVFESIDIHREALAALLLFRSAAEAERVTPDSVQRLSRYLEKARTDPSSRFQEPS